MASTRKRPSDRVLAAAGAFLAAAAVRSPVRPGDRAARRALPVTRVTVALSGGLDSVVLLHALAALRPAGRFALQAIHVHHGLSPHAQHWAKFCRALCRRLDVPLAVRKVSVVRARKGLEAAAREARYAAFREVDSDYLALAHHLDDQAETVLMNLLRGAGLRGASGMPARAAFHGRTLVRPLLELPRSDLLAYAREHGLEWVEDESNADDSLMRNFIRLRVGPLLETRFPAWKAALGRAARHFARKELRAEEALRKFLADAKLKAPGEAKLGEILKQLTSGSPRARISHDGVRLRACRGRLLIEAMEDEAEAGAAPRFEPIPWQGEARVPLPALGGELRFSKALGEGIDAGRVRAGSLTVRLRAGGERLQLHPRRPRRTLKNLFQEAGVPPRERERLPLLCCGDDVVWAPGLGIDARYRAAPDAPGIVPNLLFLRKTKRAHARIAG